MLSQLATSYKLPSSPVFWKAKAPSSSYQNPNPESSRRSRLRAPIFLRGEPFQLRGCIISLDPGSGTQRMIHPSCTPFELFGSPWFSGPWGLGKCTSWSHLRCWALKLDDQKIPVSKKHGLSKKTMDDQNKMDYQKKDHQKSKTSVSRSNWIIDC